jgi:hypothetical protein
MSSSPFDDADEADVAEQQRSATNRDDDASPTPPTASPDQADEADALEQGTEVGEDDDDYDR